MAPLARREPQLDERRHAREHMRASRACRARQGVTVAQTYAWTAAGLVVGFSNADLPGGVPRVGRRVRLAYVRDESDPGRIASAAAHGSLSSRAGRLAECDAVLRERDATRRLAVRNPSGRLEKRVLVAPLPGPLASPERVTLCDPGSPLPPHILAKVSGTCIRERERAPAPGDRCRVSSPAEKKQKQPWVGPAGVVSRHVQSEASALVFLVALNDVPTTGRFGPVRLALEVSVDAIAGHRERRAVGEELDVGVDPIA